MKLFLWKNGGGMGVHPASFSPGILSVQSKPPHPYPRGVLMALFLLFVSSLIWAAVGRLDIVAVAQGKLIPSTYVKIVQPAEAGLIREILVREGQEVEKGQVLMRMDTTQADADFRFVLEEYTRAKLDLRRVAAELDGVLFETESGDDEETYLNVLLQYESHMRSLKSAIAEQSAALARAEKEVALALETKGKLEKILPLYRQEEDAYLRLSRQGHAGFMVVVEKTRIRIEKEEEYLAQDLIIARETAAKLQAQKKIEQLISGNESRLRAEHAQISEKLNRLKAEMEKQRHRQSLMVLKAPQKGIIKDLATHTVGTVTQPGTILMTLVPISEELRAEVWLSNQDVGFVKPGCEVKLKLSAFQFQKYGMIRGVVEHVAADALDHPSSRTGAEGGEPNILVYRTLIRLNDQKLHAGDLSYSLVPGMQVVAEVKLGDRTVLEYILSPISGAFHEAGRER